ncbi:MAG: hypothetical protein R3E04_03950 [Sphingobium sp.]
MIQFGKGWGGDHCAFLGATEKLHLDFARDIGLAVGMDECADLVMALLCVAGGMLEEAAALAPLSDRDDMHYRLDRIEALIDDAGHIVKAARVIAQTASEPA